MSNLKADNCKLSTDLEIVLDKIDELTEMKHSVENSMENLVVSKSTVIHVTWLHYCLTWMVRTIFTNSHSTLLYPTFSV